MPIQAGLFLRGGGHIQVGYWKKNGDFKRKSVSQSDLEERGYAAVAALVR
jgi:hypothetical protein